jgi:2-iminobutanoate/2-iminopropanoate deaminase
MRIEGRTDAAPKPAANYSQAVRIGELVSVAGQVGIDPATGSVAGNGLPEQMARTRANIEAALQACGASMSDVIRVDIYLSDLGQFAEMNACYETWFEAPYPTRTTVGVTLGPGLLVEVTVLAVAPVR